MINRQVGEIRAMLALHLREGGASFRDIAQILNLRGPGQARELEARGRRLLRDASPLTPPPSPLIPHHD